MEFLFLAPFTLSHSLFRSILPFLNCTQQTLSLIRIIY